MDYIWVILLIVLGSAMLIKPEILWRLEHMLTVKNGEPTELHLALMRKAVSHKEVSKRY